MQHRRQLLRDPVLVQLEAEVRVDWAGQPLATHTLEMLKLETLILWNNQIGDVGSQALATAVAGGAAAGEPGSAYEQQQEVPGLV